MVLLALCFSFLHPHLEFEIIWMKAQDLLIFLCFFFMFLIMP
jgi:hypothetical protein